MTFTDISKLDLCELISENGFQCDCGIVHKASLKLVSVGAGKINDICDILKKFKCKKPFVVFDKNTRTAAGNKLLKHLTECGIDFCKCEIPSGEKKLEPCEKSVGYAVMSFCKSCDIIIGVGGGTINDICKITAKISKLPYIIVATAPSMDGFASDSSSMIFNGVKTTIPSVCPDAVVCDTDILKNAPNSMKIAGIGDMAAKYISICEWRISNLINGEYYCPKIADIMRNSVSECFKNAKAFMSGDEKATVNVIKGLVLAGIAMSFAKASRPASGIEHYFSHLWEMRAIAAGKSSVLHGTSVAVGTLCAARLYEKLKTVKPNYEKAMAYAESFNIEQWRENAKDYFGVCVPSIIATEEKENKYDKQKHKIRLQKIIENFDEIINIINEEIPPYDYLNDTLYSIGAPLSFEEIGETTQSAREAFIHTMDIRDKYILSRLVWDLGIIDEFGYFI